MGTSVPIFFRFFLCDVASLLGGKLNTVSVVIPSYNREHTLGRALDSVLQQTRAADEIIVVDDGSTDETKALIKTSYPTVKYHFQANKGVSSARNTGVEIATSDWIALLDSDDQWHKEKLKRQTVALALKPNHRILHSDEIWIRNGVQVNQKNKYRKSGGRIFEECLELCAISPSSVVIEKALLLEVGGFEETLPACEDYDMWLKICCQFPTLYVDEPLLTKYGGHDDQLSSVHWGLDRFRALSLHRFLRSKRVELLSEKELEAAKFALQKKCGILISGALKRGNLSMVDEYESLIVD